MADGDKLAEMGREIVELWAKLHRLEAEIVEERRCREAELAEERRCREEERETARRQAMKIRQAQRTELSVWDEKAEAARSVPPKHHGP